MKKIEYLNGDSDMEDMFDKMNEIIDALNEETQGEGKCCEECEPYKGDHPRCKNEDCSCHASHPTEPKEECPNSNHDWKSIPGCNGIECKLCLKTLYQKSSSSAATLSLMS